MVCCYICLILLSKCGEWDFKDTTMSTTRRGGGLPQTQKEIWKNYTIWQDFPISVERGYFWLTPWAIEHISTQDNYMWEKYRGVPHIYEGRLPFCRSSMRSGSSSSPGCKPYPRNSLISMMSSISKATSKKIQNIILSAYHVVIRILWF